MITATAVAAWLLAHPSWLERDATREDREPLVQRYAQAIVDASRNDSDVAMLVALGWTETKFATLVLAGRCDEMPAGQRCDGGRARGAFSLHREACRAAWEHDAGSEESIRAEAVCAIRQLRFHGWRCREHSITPTMGAFSGYATGGSSCHWAGAGARVLTTRRVAEELRRAEREARP